MAKTMTVTEAARGFSDLINRVHYKNETTILVRGGKPVAQLVPVLSSAKLGADLAALWATLPHLGAAEAAAFGEDIAAAKAELPKVADKWA